MRVLFLTILLAFSTELMAQSNLYVMQATKFQDSVRRQEITTCSFKVDSTKQMEVELWVQLEGGMMLFHEGKIFLGNKGDVKTFAYEIPQGSQAFWVINKRQYKAYIQKSRL